MQRNGTKREKGFSLLELMVSVAILLVAMGVVFSAMAYYQKNYQGSQIRSDTYFGIRGASELLSQEIGQAGSVGLPDTTTSAPVTGNSVLTQTVPLNQANYIFLNEQLLIDAGPKEELVKVTAVSTTPSTITGIFAKDHAAGVPVNALGVFPQGILSSSTGTSLQLFGDTNADGTIYYVEYNCDTTAGTLTRSSTPITATAKNPAQTQTLLDTLTANPNGVPCFTYNSQPSGGYTFVTNVKLTLSLRSSVPDLENGTNFTIIKDFLILSPRNILAGLELANAGVTTRLQPTPPNVPLP